MSARVLLLALGAIAGASGCRPAAVACPDGLDGEGETCVAPMPDDAGHPSPPPRVDSGQISPPPLPPPGECTAEHADRWAAAHHSNGLIDAVRGCTADPCRGTDCGFSACVATSIGASSCTGCAAREIDCLLRSCSEECGAEALQSACVSCVCRQGCRRAFETCAGRNGTPCNACHSAAESCRRPLSVELIVAAVL